MNVLKNCIKLKSRVTIYVPSTFNVDESVDNSEWVTKTLTLLANCFGGATSTKALGAWVTKDGNLVKEKVELCFSFAKQKDLEKNIDAIYDYCLAMRMELRQEAVALEVNGELYRI